MEEQRLLVFIILMAQEAEEPGIEGAGLGGIYQLDSNSCCDAKSSNLGIIALNVFCDFVKLFAPRLWGESRHRVLLTRQFGLSVAKWLRN